LKRGYEVIDGYSNATLNLFEDENPDLYLIDYKLVGSKNRKRNGGKSDSKDLNNFNHFMNHI